MGTHHGVKAVIFDKDGTLLDFAESWSPMVEALLRLLSQGDADVEAALSSKLGFVDGQFSPNSIMIAGTSADMYAAIREAMPSIEPAEISTKLATALAEATPVPVVPLRPLFKHMKGCGVAFGLVTNDDVDLARAHMAQLEIDDFFDVVIGADSGHGRKPQAGPCLAAAEALGVAPAQCVLVGDSLADMRAAKAAGMQSLGVLSGYLCANDFVGEADGVLPDIGALPAWLLSGPARQLHDLTEQS